jgi:hypothetical protein
MKTLLKFLLLVISLTFAFILLSTILPYSQTLKNASSNINLFDIVYVVYVAISSFWICLAIFYVARKSPETNNETVVCLSFSLFFIYAFMPQIETLVFNNVFWAVSRIDILFIMIANGIPVLLAVLLGVRMFRGNFKPSRYIRKSKHFTVPDIMLKLLLTGVSYMIICFVFEYFIAWRIEELRIFYTGSPRDVGFIPKLIENWNDRPYIYLIQFARGLLFGLFILPIVNMFRKKPLTMLVSILLLFETPAICLIIPNFLLPEVVRIGHFREMTSSMLFFAVITWLIFNKLTISNGGDKYY